MTPTGLAWRAGALFLSVCLAAALTMERVVGLYDEGIILTGALRVQAGDLLHRDFYANYGPGQFYAIAALFDVFGADALVARAWDVAVRGGIVAVVYLLLAQCTRRPLALAAALLSAIWACSIGNQGYPVYPALLFALLATLLLERALAHRSIAWGIAAGACIAATTLFRYDIGFFALLGLGAGAIVPPARGSAWPARGRLATLVAFAATASLLVLALLATYAAAGMLPGFYHDVIDFPSRAYARHRALPFPGLGRWWEGTRASLLGIYLPLAAVVAAACVLWSGPAREEGDAREQRARTLAALLLFLTPLFYLKGMVRVSLEHMQLALLASIPLLALAVELSARRGLALRVGVGLLCALNLLAAGAIAYQQGQRGNLVVRKWRAAGGPLAALRPEAEAARAEAIAYLAARVPPGETTFVGVGRHDKIFVNDVSVYFLAHRLPATHWHHFDPGLQTTERVQAEMVRELRERAPRFVWIETTFDDAKEPNDSAIPTGVRVLDAYLGSAYELERQFGSIRIARRRP